MQNHIAEQKIVRNIQLIRDKKVMLDYYLAELYAVDNKQLKRQVRRNIERFPEDFMFELTLEEMNDLRSQFGTSSWGGTRYLPMAFTEQGVAMLSTVLKSKTAIEVNIQIIRIFTKMRELLINNKNILLKLEQIEKKLMIHENKIDRSESEIEVIFKAIKQLLEKPKVPMKKIGYKLKDE
jgi:hypothetical protein